MWLQKCRNLQVHKFVGTDDAYGDDDSRTKLRNAHEGSDTEFTYIVIIEWVRHVIVTCMELIT